MGHMMLEWRRPSATTGNRRQSLWQSEDMSRKHKRRNWRKDRHRILRKICGGVRKL